VSRSRSSGGKFGEWMEWTSRDKIPDCSGLTGTGCGGTVIGVTRGPETHPWILSESEGA
jgi:hypothetical protein